ncbi:DNA mismatch repair protein Msh3 isoform X2 [Nematostella vectensis]|uniref:DNA mismatch repair protein Msh3 isoform X2 n=1 Tax=Nematostella vectensis TaxID=45351 RepID=UPI002077682F|nr:DNA mismatch repair protein Msh3 isoform X2 [Nematostella vectensis]
MRRVNLKKLKTSMNAEPSRDRRKPTGQSSISSFFGAKSCKSSQAFADTSSKKRAADEEAVCEDNSCKHTLEGQTKKKKLSDEVSQHLDQSFTKTVTKLKVFENDSEISNLPKEKTNPIGSDVKKNGNSIFGHFIHSRKVMDLEQYKREETATALPGSINSSLKINQRTKSVYTPLEQQFMEIKARNSDAVLFIECGYKFKFFGDDAEIAAKELNIMCFMDHNFMVASIPTHRLHIHVKRLVNKGYKVGVVKQMETAALKAASDNKSNVFTRELHALYTKSTLVGEDMEVLRGKEDAAGGDEVSLEAHGGYLMCVHEEDSGAKTGITYGIVAVQPSTGEIIYDYFPDSPSCSELETRLEHLSPSELLIHDTLSERTRSFLDVFSSYYKSADPIRTERIPDPLPSSQSDANQILQEFCNSTDETFGSSSPNSQETLLQTLLTLPLPVQKCFISLQKYLKDFKLDKVLKLAGNFEKFSTIAKFMKLNGCALQNLEILKSQCGSRKGSLLGILDHTSTPFGKRLLKRWITQPLLEKREIEERLKAVSCLSALSSDQPLLKSIHRLLSHIPDLEKGLCAIYYKKCSTVEFLSIAKALSKLHDELKSTELNSAKELAGSSILSRTFTEVPDLLSGVEDFLNQIDEKAAKCGDKTKLFTDPSKFPPVLTCIQEIDGLTAELKEHRSEIRRTIQHPSVDYCTVSGNEFLIEVRNAKLPSVPADWIKISATKQICRFRTPFVEEKFKSICQWREKLAQACQEAWLEFLDIFSTSYTRFHRAVKLVANLDCIMSLATVARQPGYVCPVIKKETEASSVLITQGRHPVIDVLLQEHAQYVPNNTELNTEGPRCMIITGPNMGGKSSYIKQVALIVLMAQMGSFVPAHSVELTPLDAIYTRMGASDHIYKGRSTFMVELQETSEILAQATRRSLVILDELGRGTSTHDGVAIAYATLRHFIDQTHSLTLFVTHYPSLAELERIFPGHVTNNHMAFMTSDGDVTSGENDITDVALETDVIIQAAIGASFDGLAKTELASVAMDTPAVTFLYELVRGVAARSYGLNVARLAGIPINIVAMAAGKSHDLESEIANRRSNRMKFQEIWRVNSTDSIRNTLSMVKKN